MMHDEKGYVQFRCDWEPAEAPAVFAPAEQLVEWRNQLHRLGLIGAYPDGIGYGNLSVRLPIFPSPRWGEGGERRSREPGKGIAAGPSAPAPLPSGERRGICFLITGTATGGIPAIGPEHITEVIAYDIASNRLRCRGPVQASSESLSHAAVYECDPMIVAVIHVHHLVLWEQLRGIIPTTDPAAEAGTPQMARAIMELLNDPAARDRGLFVMGGHREGLMAFGKTLDEAGETIIRLDRAG